MEEEQTQKKIESQLLDLTNKMNILKSDLITSDKDNTVEFVSPNRDIPEK